MIWPEELLMSKSIAEEKSLNDVRTCSSIEREFAFVTGKIQKSEKKKLRLPPELRSRGWVIFVDFFIG